jgi:hypothetical protein
MTQNLRNRRRKLVLPREFFIERQKLLSLKEHLQFLMKSFLKFFILVSKVFKKKKKNLTRKKSELQSQTNLLYNNNKSYTEGTVLRVTTYFIPIF